MDTVSPLIGPLPENAGGPEDDDMNNDPNFKVDGEVLTVTGIDRR